MNRKPYIVGLTGGVASGKSTIAEIFNAYGISIVDADVASRKVVEPGTAGYQGILEHFGRVVLLDRDDPESPLDRGHLRNLIFQDMGERLWLNNLLHPLIRTWMLEQTLKAESDYVIQVVPLLFENNMQSLFNKIIVVDVPVEVQVERLMARDNSSREQALAIINAQVERDTRLSGADFIIDNNRKRQEVESSVISLHNQLLELSHT